MSLGERLGACAPMAQRGTLTEFPLTQACYSDYYYVICDSSEMTLTACHAATQIRLQGSCLHEVASYPSNGTNNLNKIILIAT